MLLRKVLMVLGILVAGLVVFGVLPKSVSDRLARGLLALMVIGFLVRVGAYLLSP